MRTWISVGEADMWHKRALCKETLNLAYGFQVCRVQKLLDPRLLIKTPSWSLRFKSRVPRFNGMFAKFSIAIQNAFIILICSQIVIKCIESELLH